MRFIHVVIPLLVTCAQVRAQCSVGGGGTAPAAPNVLFVTSQKFNGVLGGVGGANTICQNLAASQSATPYIQANAEGFIALLGSSTQDPNDLWGANFGLDIVNSRGDCIAAGMTDLFTNRNLNDEIFDETGAAPAVNTVVFTGSTSAAARYQSNPGTTTADDYCSDFTSTAGSTAVGALNSPTNDASTEWLKTTTLPVNTNADCDSPTHALYCALASQPSSVQADPQFVGLQGQQFQIHGVPDEYFNLISHPEFQMNSRFVYLATGKCDYNTTACWTHPGTYVDEIGFMWNSLKVRAVARPHDQGLIVYINDQKLNNDDRIGIKVIPKHQHQHDDDQQHQQVQESTVTIHQISYDRVTIKSPLFSFSIVNSDMFFNFDVVFHDRSLLRAGSRMHTIPHEKSANHHHHHHDINKNTTSDINNNHIVSKHYPAYPMHGLIGITWKNARYSDTDNIMIPGHVDDYLLHDHQLFSTQFLYNQFKH